MINNSMSCVSIKQRPLSKHRSKIPLFWYHRGFKELNCTRHPSPYDVEREINHKEVTSSTNIHKFRIKLLCFKGCTYSRNIPTILNADTWSPAFCGCNAWSVIMSIWSPSVTYYPHVLSRHLSQCKWSPRYYPVCRRMW